MINTSEVERKKNNTYNESLNHNSNLKNQIIDMKAKKFIAQNNIAMLDNAYLAEKAIGNLDVIYKSYPGCSYIQKLIIHHNYGHIVSQRVIFKIYFLD